MARRVLTTADRIEISTGGVKAGWGVRCLARHLGRDPGVISREIRRNRNVDGTYRAVGADVRAERRRARPQARKVTARPVLRARVLADLRESRTPRQIAGRLRLEAADASVELMPNSLPADGHVASHEAIYQFIYAMPRAELVKHSVFLQSKRTRRHARPQPGTRTKRAPIIGMTPLSERDLGALERRVPGHWEGDLIIGKNGASCAITLVERMSRYVTILACLMGKDSASIAEILVEHASELPEMMRASLAWDQGSEMARHGALRLATDLPVNFADPHSPRQRPSNETPPRCAFEREAPPTNRLIREYLPKSEAIPAHQPYLRAISTELNAPRATLGYLTTREPFQRLLTDQPHVASTP